VTTIKRLNSKLNAPENLGTRARAALCVWLKPAVMVLVVLMNLLLVWAEAAKKKCLKE